MKRKHQTKDTYEHNKRKRTHLNRNGLTNDTLEKEIENGHFWKCKHLKKGNLGKDTSEKGQLWKQNYEERTISSRNNLRKNNSEQDQSETRQF